MNDIICPHCKKTFPASRAFAHHLDEERKKIEDEKNKLRNEAQKWKELKEKEFAEEAARLKKQQETELRKKIEEETALKLKDSKNEAEELAQKNKKLQDDLLEMNKSIRLMKTRQEELELENQKKLAAAEEAIKNEAKKHAEEQAHFKILELEKRLLDVSKVNEDLKRKLEQGSQQMQGEVLELEFEDSLIREFPYDEIKPVPKGIRGADIMHVVHNNSGITCGTIIWEFKRTKAWSNEWIQKLKDDQRAVKADLAVIISIVVPDSVKILGEVQGVIVGEHNAALGIAKLLRLKLIEEAALRNASQNSGDKKEMLYNYVRSTEFKHRVEAIGEAFHLQRELLRKEKDWFTKKWSKQEKMIDKMANNTIGMMGELESIMGKELKAMEELDMLPDDIELEVTHVTEVTIEEQPVEEQLF